MKSTLLHFATYNDIAIGLQSMLDSHNLILYQTGQYHAQKAYSFSRSDDLCNMFLNEVGDFIFSKSFLVVYSTSQPTLIKVHKGNKYLYELSLEGNPCSVIYTPSSIFNKSIIRGEIVMTPDVVSKEIVRLFRKYVFVEFAKHGIYRIGKDAIRLSKYSGFRLVTMGIDEDPIYDFSL